MHHRAAWTCSLLWLASTGFIPAQAQTVSTPGIHEVAAVVEKPAPTYRKGALISIHGEISNVTAESIDRRIRAARDEGAEIIIFDLDTPGGMVSSALTICNTIKNLADIHTVAWVHPSAYSAGSMISVACDEIVMSPASVIGDCGVILGGPTGPQSVPEALRAKAESPVLEQFRDSAARNGYDHLLCESLVVKERVVYWIENIETGERRFVDQDTKTKLVGGEAKDLGFSAQDGEEQKTHAWKLVESYPDAVTGRSVKVIQPVVTDNELLTMSQSKATAFGFSKGIVSSVAALKERYGIKSELATFDASWSESFTGWLTSMPVRIFLLVLILLGAYVEFNTPGVGVPGAVALICLAIFVGAPYMTGLANIWEVVLILIGFALLAVEIFVIPGFGVAGLSGIFCILIGLLATFIPDEPGRSFPIYWPHMEQGVEGLKRGVIVLGAGCAAGLAAMILFSRVMPRIRWLRSAMPMNPAAPQGVSHDPYDGYARVGDVGTVESTLRPAGKARFGTMLVDVVTEGDFVEPPGEVQVVERSGNRVVVRRIT